MQLLSAKGCCCWLSAPLLDSWLQLRLFILYFVEGSLRAFACTAGQRCPGADQPTPAVGIAACKRHNGPETRSTCAAAPALLKLPASSAHRLLTPPWTLAACRGHIARKRLRSSSRLHEAASAIQLAWRRQRSRAKHLLRIQKLHLERDTAFRHLQQKLARWGNPVGRLFACLRHTPVCRRLVWHTAAEDVATLLPACA